MIPDRRAMHRRQIRGNTVTSELSGDLIATAVCHCDHCQRQGGGAFSVNLVAHESQLAVTGALPGMSVSLERE